MWIQGETTPFRPLLFRFVAYVIYGAVGLVLEKYGHGDSCGVALGMGEECAYGWLGLDY
jgi:hypothetical protein|eukprot:SAG25_NODE_2510_length_1559_cov_2.168493_2_plen_59_part_00